MKKNLIVIAAIAITSFTVSAKESTPCIFNSQQIHCEMKGIESNVISICKDLSAFQKDEKRIINRKSVIDRLNAIIGHVNTAKEYGEKQNKEGFPEMVSGVSDSATQIIDNLNMSRAPLITKQEAEQAAATLDEMLALGAAGHQIHAADANVVIQAKCLQ